MKLVMWSICLVSYRLPKEEAECLCDAECLGDSAIRLNTLLTHS